MELTIKGEAKEIADLVFALQGQQSEEVSVGLGGEPMVESVLEAIHGKPEDKEG